MIYLGGVIFLLYAVFKLMYIVFPLKDRKAPQVKKKVTCYKSFAILVPSYNEKDVILNCLGSLINLQYPNYSVYIIDDGCTDSTFQILDEALLLMPARLNQDTRLTCSRIKSAHRSRIHPNFYVIRKENGGKADALNAGIACCAEEIVVTLDADCMLKDDALGIMNEEFQSESVIAAGGTVHITQSIDSRDTAKMIFKLKNLIRYQVIQYLVAFYMHKLTQSRFKSLIVVSGAYGAFKRSLLIKLNGYRKTVGEDMDITLKIQQYIKTNNKRYLISFVPQSVCYTECPESFKNLLQQRIRWQKAFIDCTLKYGAKMFRRFNASLSFFFIFDYLILGTVTSFLFFLLPLFLLLGSKLSFVFIFLFAADLLLGVAECFVSKRMATRYNFCFLGTDNFRVGLFIPLKVMICKLLNLLFVVTGTFSYFVSRERWNKAERLGRCFSGAPGMGFHGEGVKAK